MAIPQSFIQELLARTDVVDVVGKHVQLKKGGANFMGLCPFHDEKSPSFSVSPAKQFYHCFGCGASGDAIKFLTEYTAASFVEAVQDLAQQAGLQVPEDHATAEDRERAAAQRQRQVTLHDVLERAGDAYRRHLKDSPRAVEYLKGRGLSGEIAKRFGLGYAPEGWRALASVFPAYDDPLLVESGLVIAGDDDGGATPAAERKRYDRFRDRVMFPIRNVKGECIGYGGRVLGDEKPKYLNSPETPVFSKGRELYGLFEARTALRDAGHALVTEGYMDVVALAQLGFPHAVATLGTACTADHVQKLFRFTDTIVFSFDGDSAGRRAARKALDAALPFATDTRAVKFLFLPAEHDPDSFVRAHGREAFAQYVTDALPLSRFLIEAAREGCDLGTAEGRARMASQARPLWNLLPDGALRRQLVGEIAAQVQLDTRELAELWAAAGVQDRRARPGRDGGRATRDPRPAAQDDGLAWQADEPNWDRGFGDGGRREHYGGGGRNPRGAGHMGGGGHRTPPVSRADHAARLLLTQSAALDTLSHEDREMLCALPAPHGPLFVWLEGQLHEHGAQPWAALREGLHGQAGEDLAVRLMAGPHADTEPDAREFRRELRGLLDRMLVEQLEAEQRAAIAEASTDPAALERYKSLDARLRPLRAALNART